MSQLRPIAPADTPAGSTAVEPKQAAGSSIPIEWSISIDDEGHATVDDRQGRMTAGAGDEQGAAAGQGAVLAGAKRKGERPEDGEAVLLSTVLCAEMEHLEYLQPWTSCLLGVRSPAIAQPCTGQHQLACKRARSIQGENPAALLSGQIRGGGGKAGEEAEKAIEAIRDAKKLLGEGPRFKEVDASAINAGDASSRCVPQMHSLHWCRSRKPVVSLLCPHVASLQGPKESSSEPGRYLQE